MISIALGNGNKPVILELSKSSFSSDSHDHYFSSADKSLQHYLSETEKSIKIAIRIRFDSIHSIFDSIRFGLLFEIHNSVRLDSTDSIFDSIRFDSTHPQQNIVFFVLCSTHYVRLQKRLSISP